MLLQRSSSSKWAKLTTCCSCWKAYSCFSSISPRRWTVCNVLHNISCTCCLLTLSHSHAIYCSRNAYLKPAITPWLCGRYPPNSNTFDNFLSPRSEFVLRKWLTGTAELFGKAGAIIFPGISNFSFFYRFDIPQWLLIVCWLWYICLRMDMMFFGPIYPHDPSLAACCSFYLHAHGSAKCLAVLLLHGYA